MWSRLFLFGFFEEAHMLLISRLENGHKQPTLTTLFKIVECVELLISKIKIMHQDHEK